MWHIDPLLGNDRETHETTAIAMQRLSKYATVLELLLGSGLEVMLKAVFSIDPHRGYVTRPTELK